MRRAAGTIATVEIWLILIAVAGSVIVERLLPEAFALVGSLVLVRWLAAGRPSVRTPIDLPVAALLLMTCLTLLVTAYPAITLPQVYRLLIGVGLCYAIVNWATTRTRVHLVAVGSALFGLLLAISALFTVQWLTAKFPFIPQAIYAHLAPRVSRVVNPAVIAGSLVILVPVPLGVVLFGRVPGGRPSRAAAGSIALFMIGTLVLTQARAALLALGAVLAVLMLLRWPRSWIVLLVALIAGSLAAYMLGAHALVTRFVTGGTVSDRVEIWTRALYMIEDFPYTGVGMGVFEEASKAMYPLLFSAQDLPHAHNLFLQVAVDLGIPGLIAWLAIVVLVIRASWRTYLFGMRQQDGLVAALGAGLLASTVALLVNGLGDAVTWGLPRAAVIPWGLWGIAIAAARVTIQARPGVHMARHIDEGPTTYE